MKKVLSLLVILGLVSGTLRVGAQISETNSFTNLNQLIPDGNSAGLHDVRTVSSAITNLTSVRLKLRVAGEFNGDLYGYVRHTRGNTTNFCVLLNRAGRTLANANGYADAGLLVTLDDAAPNGDIHQYRTVTTPAAGTPLTGKWRPDGRKLDPEVALDTTARTATFSSFTNAPADGEWTLYLADLAAGGTNMLVNWELEFTGIARPAVTWPTPADLVYGTALSGTQLNASSPVPGTFAYNPPAGTVLNASNNQTLSVTFTPTDTLSYVVVTTNVSLNVLKKALTITAVSTNKVYGAALPVLRAGYVGFVNGDTTNNLTAQAVLSTTATAASPVGGYPITVSGATSLNYTIGFVAGTLTVDKAALTITAVSTNKVYGAALPVLRAGYVGFVNGDTTNNLTAQAVLSTTATAASPVGGYPITVSGATSLNYTIGFVAGTLTVDKAALTITAVSTNKVYGAALPIFTAGYVGFVNGDTTNNLTAQAVLSTTATAASAVGGYPITVGGATSLNYTIGFVAGTLTVDKATLTITAVSTNKVYGAALPVLRAGYVGFVNGDTTNNLTAQAVLSTTATAASPVGGYPITVSGATSLNYTIGFVAGTLTVDKATLTITAGNRAKTYGDAVVFAGSEFSPTGLVNSDTVTSVTLSSAGAAGTATVAGSPYAIVPSAAVGTGLGNYTIGYANGTLTVTPAALTGLVTSSANPALPGQAVSFTLTLSASTATGGVQFKIDGSNAGGPVALSGGVGSYASSTLTHGPHTVRAEYAGDGNFVGTTNLLAPAQLINTLPVAGGDTLERGPTNTVKVAIATLLTNDTDADGDAVAYLSADASSANGGTVVSNAGWLFYTPAVGFTNADTFTYTISDGFGGPVSGTVTVNIRLDNGPSPNLTISDLGGGTYAIRGDGIPGRTYRLEFATNPVTPSWQPLGPATADPTGFFVLIDGSGSPQRFYRSVYP